MKKTRLLAALAGLVPLVFALWLGWFVAPTQDRVAWETLWLDQLQVLRYELRGSDPPEPGVLLIGIDRDTFQTLDQPAIFWLDDLARLTEALFANGARAVAFDMIHPVADGVSAPVAAQLLDEKLALMSQIAQHPVALGFLPDDENGPGEHNDEDLEQTATEKKSLCNLGLIAGDDGIHRFLMPVLGSGKRQNPALSLWIVEQLGHKVEATTGDVRVDGVAVPLETYRELPVLRLAYRVPFYQPLSGGDLFRRLKAGKPIPEAKGKVCLIAPWLHVMDHRPSPLDRLAEKQNVGGTYGVEHHLAAVETMVRGTYLVPYSPWTGSVVSLVLAGWMMAVGYLVTGRWNGAVAVFSGLAYVVVSTCAFVFANQWWPFWSPLISGLLGYAVGYQGRYFMVERERRLTVDMFSRMVSPQVVEKVLSEPGLRQLGGTQRRVTVLYTDINDFTPMCERHTPAEVIIMLNQYFEEMVHIVFQHHGMLKQFVGDEIMVIYGAPADQPDHAARAVSTALDMLERLNHMEVAANGQDGFFDIKVGINTGDVVVGHVGSEKHMEYAAVGDDVNLGARIMATTKKLGVSILVSETTKQEAEALLPDVEWISRGVQSFKGKTAQMEVFEVRRRRLD